MLGFTVGLTDGIMDGRILTLGGIIEFTVGHSVGYTLMHTLGLITVRVGLDDG